MTKQLDLTNRERQARFRAARKGEQAQQAAQRTARVIRDACQAKAKPAAKPTTAAATVPPHLIELLHKLDRLFGECWLEPIYDDSDQVLLAFPRELIEELWPDAPATG